VSSEFINFYLKDRQKELKRKWKIISFLEDELLETSETDGKILKNENTKKIVKENKSKTIILKKENSDVNIMNTDTANKHKNKHRNYYSILKLKEILKNKNNAT